MKNFSRKIIIFIFILFLVSFCSRINVKSSNLKLNNLDFDVEILENGDMNVKETWDIDIKNTNTLFKTFETDITKYLDIDNVSVREITNGESKRLRKVTRYSYHVDKDAYYGLINNDGDFEIAWGVGLDNERDTRTYEISYTVEGAIGGYTDCNELYWQFVGDDFEIDAKKITGKITLPKEVQNKEEIKVWGHTKGLNGEIYATSNNKIEFTIDNFKSGTYVEVRTLFPKDVLEGSLDRTYNHPILEAALEEEGEWAKEANEIRSQRFILAIFFYIIVFVISILLIINIIKKIKLIKNRKKRKSDEEIIYYREIPRKDCSPAEALYLEKEIKGELPSNDIGKVFSATLLKFSLEKLIEIENKKNEKGKDEIYIKLLDKEKILGLKNEDEKAIGKFLISAFGGRTNTSISVKDLEKFIKNSSQNKILKLQSDIKEKPKEKLTDNKLIDKKEVNKYTKESSHQAMIIGSVIIVVFLAFKIFELLGNLTITGIIIVFALLFLNIIVNGIAISKINVFTIEGVNEIAKWKGLKKYMEEFSLLNEKEVPQIAIWEEFLVYATAFGIADKVLEQLKLVYPDIENEININTSPYMHLMISTNFSKSFTSAISSSMTSAYTSASGGGGGFSGGGRWRPVAGGGGGGR